MPTATPRGPGAPGPRRVQDRAIDATDALLAAATAHAAFQAVVTVVVYPALVATPGPGFARVHAAHSRRITPVVAGVYGALLAAWGWVLVQGPPTPWLVAALAGSVGALGATAFVAAPTHARLGRDGPRPRLVRRLLRADAVRLAGALLTVVAVLGAELARTR